MAILANYSSASLFSSYHHKNTANLIFKFKSAMPFLLLRFRYKNSAESHYQNLCCVFINFYKVLLDVAILYNLLIS